MSYGNNFYGSLDFAPIKLAIEASGGPDLQRLVEIFADLDTKMRASQSQYNAQNAAAQKLADGLKAQQAAVYGVGEAYDLLQPAIGAALTAAEKEAAATVWMKKQADDLSEALEDLAEHERTAERATIALDAAQEKAGGGAKKAGDAGGYGALKWLFLSNALQDVQYGLGAVANNVPQLVQSFGGSGGLAGGLQVAIVALQIAINNAGKLRDLFGSQMPENYKNSVKGLTEELDKLNSKRIKIPADVTAIEEAQRKLDRLKETEAEWDRLKTKRSKAQQESGERAERAIVEYGGGDDEKSSADKVRAGVRAADPFTSGKEEAELRARIAAQQKVLNATTDPQQRSFVQQQIAALRDSIEGARGNDLKAYNAQVEALVANAGLGKQADISKLLDLYRRNTQAFSDQGVTEGFGPALAKASKNVVDRDAYDKLDEDARKKAQAAADKEDEWYDKVMAENEDRNSKQWAKLDEDSRKEVEADRKKRVGAAVAQYGPGYAAQETAGFFEGAKNGADLDAIARGEAKPLGAALLKRGVSTDIVAEVTGTIIDKARQAALNHVAAGTTPTAIGKEAREVEQVAKKYGAGYLPQARALIAQNRAARLSGVPEVTSDEDEMFMRAQNLPYSLPDVVVGRRLARGIGQGLQGAGQDPAAGGAVAKQAFEDVDQAYSKALAQTGNQFDATAAVVRSMAGAVAGMQGMLSSQQEQVRGLQQAAEQLHGNNARLHAQAQRGRTRRASLNTY